MHTKGLVTVPGTVVAIIPVILVIPEIFLKVKLPRGQT